MKRQMTPPHADTRPLERELAGLPQLRQFANDRDRAAALRALRRRMESRMSYPIGRGSPYSSVRPSLRRSRQRAGAVPCRDRSHGGHGRVLPALPAGRPVDGAAGAVHPFTLNHDLDKHRAHDGDVKRAADWAQGKLPLVR